MATPSRASGGAKGGLPFPYRFGMPRFPNKHAGQKFMELYQQQGHIRKCAHAHLGQWGGMMDPAEYGPECEQASFLLIPDPAASPYELAEDVFFGCPPDCRFFVSAPRARLDRGTAAIGRGLLAVVRAPFFTARWLLTWYAGLPATTQALLILVPLLVLGILTWSQLVEVFDRVRGK